MDFLPFVFIFISRERASDDKKTKLKIHFIKYFFELKDSMQRLLVTSASSRDDRLCMPFDYSMKQFLHCVWHPCTRDQMRYDRIASHSAGVTNSAALIYTWNENVPNAHLWWCTTTTTTKGVRRRNQKKLKRLQKTTQWTSGRNKLMCNMNVVYVFFLPLSLARSFLSREH